MSAGDPRDQPPPRADQARTWGRYLRFFGPRVADDLDDELRFHIEMRVREYRARGLSDAEARAETARRLGDMAAARDECLLIATRRERRLTRTEFVDHLRQDVAFALRTLGRNRGWTAIAVLTLALGIGANSAMFSVVNHLILNPLRYPDANRVVLASLQPTEGGMANVMVTPGLQVVTAWRKSARSLEAMEPYSSTDVMLELRDAPPRVLHAASVRPTFPAFAGERLLAGRMFTAHEADTDAPVALLGEGLWRAHYGADASVVGRTITVNGKPLTVIGVLPATLRLPRIRDEKPELWTPLNLTRESHGFWVVARMREGIEIGAAQRELDEIAKRPESVQSMHAQYDALLRRPGEMVSFRESLVLLSAAVGLVLLIACANVVHLLLARASTRQRELAVRSALGAGRGRLLRQLLTESLLLAGAGGVAGLLVGWASLRLLVAARPRSLAELESATMDGTTLLVTAGVAVLTGVAFGILGAFQASRLSTSEALKAGTPAAAWGRGQGRARSLLVMTEMALCTMLLVGAALLIRSVVQLQAKDLGFDPRGMYALSVTLPDDRYATPAARNAFGAALVERVRGIPGVAAVTVASSQPTYTNYMIGALQVEGNPDPPADQTSLINYNAVEPGYFAFMGIPIVEGTTFTDTTAGARQVILNRAMADKLWPGASAIGRRVRVVYAGQGDWTTVVGIAADASTSGYTADATTPMMYGSRGNAGFFGSALLVRAAPDARFVGLLTALPAAIDNRLPPPQVMSVEDAMRGTMARPRFTMVLLATFTVMAVGLAAIGLYGVLAYSVSLRTREIGIRMALGATRQTVGRAVLRQGLLMAGIGGLVGVIVARKGARLLSHTLYGVQESDPVAFTGAVAVLILIAVLACLVPARRAVSVDPMVAIRSD